MKELSDHQYRVRVFIARGGGVVIGIMLFVHGVNYGILYPGLGAILFGMVGHWLIGGLLGIYSK